MALRNLPFLSTKAICFWKGTSGVPYVSKRLKLTQAKALRPKKPKSTAQQSQYFADSKLVRTVGGRGGDGCISFLQLWCNERAGPDGGDGGNGGHIIFQASAEVSNFNHVSSAIRADVGDDGANKNCHGKNAKHTIVKVPLGTIIRDTNGRIVGDLERTDMMFVAARGGAGGKGNRFFASSTKTSPKICEYGPDGEDASYLLELRTMAHMCFIGFPNAGKSTLLNAITRAKPKVAPYAFTTLHPHIGVVPYEDYTQLVVADLPGLIPGSHRNKGLGIQFLKHVERCSALLFVIDASSENPWDHYEQLVHELQHYNDQILKRPQLLVANKLDQPGAQENYFELKRRVKLPSIAVSAKMGTNLSQLLAMMRTYYDKHKEQSKEQVLC